MPAPRLTMATFVSDADTYDLARANLFTVVFGSFNKSITEGGFLEDLGIDSDRITDFATSYLRSRSTLVDKVIRGSNSSVVRGVMGSDYLKQVGMAYDVAKKIGMMVKAVNIPSSTIEISENRNRKKPQHTPTNRTEETVTMTVYMAAAHDERFLMQQWLDKVFDSERSQVGFPVNYTQTIEIYTYDRSGIAQAVTTLSDAFPIRVGGVQLDWDSGSQIATFEVEWTYSVATKRVLEDSEKNSGDLIEQGRTALNILT